MYEIELIPDVEGCVYRLWYYGKFIIVKCKTFVRSKANIEYSLQHSFKNSTWSDKTYSLFFNFIIANPGHNFVIDILCSSNNPYQLLKAEHIELLKAKDDSRCLNAKFSPYIPQLTNKKGERSWINKGYYLNYMKWKQKFTKNELI
jgi:hypothetical protein